MVFVDDLLLIFQQPVDIRFVVHGLVNGGGGRLAVNIKAALNKSIQNLSERAS